jgi:hypothetical protein
MRTTVIPAQITTVEDKIAGSLNLTQILLLMVPVFWTTIVYTLFYPSMKLVWYKPPLVVLVLIISLILAVRIKGKIVLHWLLMLFRFNTRPKYYLFNKNDSYLRTIDMPVFEKKQHKLFKKAKVTREVKAAIPHFNPSEMIQFENVIRNQNISLSFKTSKKGGFNVAFEQIQK